MFLVAFDLPLDSKREELDLFFVFDVFRTGKQSSMLDKLRPKVQIEFTIIVHICFIRQACSSVSNARLASLRSHLTYLKDFRLHHSLCLVEKEIPLRTVSIYDRKAFG
ncbi:hypothetical protein KC361_g189 [Hortaea werneckii]|nr:hypothetical protein KC361_g189 [Hortaea werneckii]